MNKRIKELAKEAGAEFWQRLENDVVNPEAYITFDPPEGLGQFAELIVQECARIGELKEQGYSEYDPDISVGWYMRQHFGVEDPPVDNVDRILRTVRKRSK